MGHRRKPKRLSDRDREEILKAATDFNHALCRPQIDVKCADYVAKQKAHEAVIQLFEDLTGKPPPWVYATNSPPYKAPPHQE